MHRIVQRYLEPDGYQQHDRDRAIEGGRITSPEPGNRNAGGLHRHQRTAGPHLRHRRR